ncbi:10652_t:CDS:1 [Acaulospora morrowiae]|uniref:10652_t:CDS:1 n=1 Tax=Acaulospora morrowiae TaxID=94023 RepID=A0A9N9GJT9_9GLOM|nr:10652_t:CDS:1 [Acaulospora morrowiae]
MKVSIILIALIVVVLMVVVDVDGARHRNLRKQRNSRNRNQTSAQGNLGASTTQDSQGASTTQDSQGASTTQDSQGASTTQDSQGASTTQNSQASSSTAADPPPAATNTLSPPSNLLSNDICKNSNQPSTGGKQNKGGSCSDTIQGQIPSVENMISTIITNPQNGDTIPANEPFNVSVLTNNLDLGFFDNPQTQYYAFPQSLNDQGQIFGHQHVTIQQLSGNGPPDPQNFAFFKGLNDPSNSGQLSVAVASSAGPGLPPGFYRICTMTGTFSHQPVLMPVAQRGAQDDCIRVNVK